MRIALVRLSALGDIINTTVVLQFVKRHFPRARVEWITEEAFAPLLQDHPDLHAVHSVPLKRIKKEKNFTLLMQTVRKLRRLGSYDQIIDMQGLLKSALTARLIGKNVHGYDSASARESLAALFYETSSSIPYAENIIRRNCRLVAEALGFAVSDKEILEKAPTLPILERPAFLPQGKKCVAIVVGASWPSKQYPKELWAALCGLLDARVVLIWGTQKEHEDAEWIATHAANAEVAPKLTLPQLTAVIAHADLTLGNDTGPTHLAWALNRPSVTLFGPTTPRMMFETPDNVAIESDSDVDITKIDKYDFSIRHIDPQAVADAAEELL
jgi:heptosyltransferase-1